MARYYDKDKLKESLKSEQIFDLLESWSGNPTIQDKCIISDTICHNLPNEGSHKLYYYFDTQLFHCYTGCDTFDIFELCIKVMNIQKSLKWELYDAMDYIASYFGYEDSIIIEEQELKDWEVFNKHKQLPLTNKTFILPEYDSKILNFFSYPKILGWEKEGILPQVIKSNYIGYYPVQEQITIPHFDLYGRLIGIRGRTLSIEDGERYGKYRPLKVGNIQYNHPLSMNLYNLNNSKDNIKRAGIAIMFESEKSTLIYQSYYGHDNDISVACCGSSISSYQISLLKLLGCREVIIAFDRDFAEINDEIFKRIKSRLISIYNKYNNSIKITAIFDKHLLLPIKASPIDSSKEIFEQLLKERIIPNG